MDTYMDTKADIQMKKGFRPRAESFCEFLGARSESRTRTPLPAVDFESTASTCSAIRAIFRSAAIAGSCKGMIVVFQYTVNSKARQLENHNLNPKKSQCRVRSDC